MRQSLATRLNKKESDMSIVYCEYCDEYIDTDFDSEHFDDDGKCWEELLEESQ